MFLEYDPQDITRRLLSYIGEPYEKDGCIRFVRRALWEFGVEIDGQAGSLHDARLFVKTAEGALGTVIVWKGITVGASLFHVGLMLDKRWALQSSRATNGVGRIEITREPWQRGFKGFYRPRQLCS